MELSELNDEMPLTADQHMDLGILLRIDNAQGVKASDPFWVHYRYRLKSGEFGEIFEEWSEYARFDISTLEKRQEVWEVYLSWLKYIGTK